MDGEDFWRIMIGKAWKGGKMAFRLDPSVEGLPEEMMRGQEAPCYKVGDAQWLVFWHGREASLEVKLTDMFGMLIKKMMA